MRLTLRVKITVLVAALFLFFIVVLLVVLPTVLINRADIKAALQQRLNATLGVEVTFDRVELTLIPRICATIDNPRLSLPGDRSIRVKEINLCLKFLPLLRGEFTLSTVRAQSPEIIMPVKPFYASERDAVIPGLSSILAIAREWLKRMPRVDAEVVDGRITLRGPNGTAFELREANLTLKHGFGNLEWSLDSKSSELKALSAAGRLNPETFEGTARLSLREFQPQRLYAFFLPQSRFQVHDTRADFDVSLILNGTDRLNAEVRAKAPVLTLSQNHRESQLSIEQFKAEVDLSKKRLAVSVSQFESSSPSASVTGMAVIDEDLQPRIDFNLEGRCNATEVREVALALLHEFEDVRLVFDILRGGEVPSILANLHGDKWDDLTRLKNLRIRGRLEEGRIHIPHVEIDPERVSGEVVISEGILEGTNLNAHYRGTRGENGLLRLGLTKANPVLQLNIFMNADLEHLPPVLARVVASEEFQRELKKILAFSGRAHGSLHLDGTLKDVAVRVDASDLDVQCRYQPIPYPLGFQGGGFVYDGDRITLAGVDVAMGGSKLFKHNVNIGLKGDMPIEAHSPKAVIDLAEMFTLLRERPPFKQIGSLAGVATFHDWRLSGRAFVPDTWRLKSNGTLQDLSVESELMPGLALHLDSGRFDWLDQTIRYESAKASIGRSEAAGLAVEVDWAGPISMRVRTAEMDAAVDDVSRVMRSFPYLSSYDEILSSLGGRVRLQNASARMRVIPEGLVLDEFQAALKRSGIASAKIGLPLTLTSGSLAWKGSKLDVQVSQASLGQSEIRDLSAAVDWNAGGTLRLRTDSAFLECGELFPRLMSMPGLLQGLREDVKAIQGTVMLRNSTLTGPIRDPRRWHMRLESEFKDVVITTTFLHEPIEIPYGRLTATGSEISESAFTVLHIDSTRLQSGPDSIAAEGDVTFYASETAIDLAIAAEGIDWNKIEKISGQIAGRRKSESRAVRGWIRVRAERLTFERFRLYPFYANARLTPQGTQIMIERASFCGMLFAGRLAFDGPLLDAYLVPVVDVMQLDGVVACLSDEQFLYTGNFNLDGSLSFRGRREDIVSALHGRLKLVAEDGTIKRSFFFARLFSLLNLTEIYRGQLPDFENEGLDYKRMMASLEVKDGKIMVPSWSIDGRTLWMGARGEIDIATGNIDFTIMVSPFKTIDRIINSIPGIRWILGGRLVAIPVKAGGTIENPNITPMSPSAVGTSIIEMIERTLTLPIEIVQPLVPGMEETEGGTIRK